MCPLQIRYPRTIQHPQCTLLLYSVELLGYSVRKLAKELNTLAKEYRIYSGLLTYLIGFKSVFS